MIHTSMFTANHPRRFLSLLFALLVLVGNLWAAPPSKGNQKKGSDGDVPYWLLEQEIVDAAFARKSDILVTVSANPGRLSRIEIGAQSKHSIDLGTSPTSLSISPDGSYAAVGHDGTMSYVNLRTLVVEHVYDAGFRIHDLLIAPNGWVYLTEPGNQTQYIRSLNLDNGRIAEVVYDQNIGWGDLSCRECELTLAPDGTTVYMHSDSRFGGIKEFDVSNGAIEYIRRFPNVRSSMGAWLLEDGNRILDAVGEIYTIPQSGGGLATVVGNLDENTRPIFADASSRGGHLLAVPTTRRRPPNVEPADVQVYDLDTLELKRNVNLPIPTTDLGIEYDAAQRFAFATRKADSFHALYQIEAAYEGYSSWAIATHDLTLNEFALFDSPDALTLSTEDVTANCLDNYVAVQLSNLGADTRTWSATTNSQALSLQTYGGILPTAASHVLQIEIDWSTLTEASTHTIEIVDDTGAQYRFTLHLPDPRGCIDANWDLGFTVTDAAYSESLNRIIAVGSEPDALYVLDPNTRTTESLALTSPAFTVGLSLEGHQAVVGHDYRIAHVALDPLQLIDEIDVSTNVREIAFAENGWIYFLPGADAEGNEPEYPTIRSVNASSHVEVQMYQSYAGIEQLQLLSDGRLGYGGAVHVPQDDGTLSGFTEYPSPAVSRNSIYTSPFYITRDIRQVYRYDTSWEVNWRPDAPGREVWVADPGVRFRAVADSADGQYVFVIREPVATWRPRIHTIDLLSRTTHTHLTTLPLPGWDIGSEDGVNRYPSEGRYVFSHPEAGTFYTLHTRESGGELPERWGLSTYHIGGGFSAQPAQTTRLEPSTPVVDLASSTRQEVVTLTNTGNTHIEWTAVSDTDHLATRPPNGTLEPGDSTDVTVSARHLKQLKFAEIHELRFSVKGASYTPVQVKILSPEYEDDTLWAFEHTVLDAAFDRTRDRLFTVSARPNRLHMIDPDDRTIQSLDLPSEPTSIAITGDGRFAAIGHVGLVTIIDLEEFLVENIGDIGEHTVLDIAIRSDQWVYFTTTLFELWTLDAYTDELHESLDGVHHTKLSRKVVFDASRDAVYTASRNFLLWFDASTYVAQFAYDQSFLGQVEHRRNMWLSDNDQLLITDGANVLEKHPTGSYFNHIGNFESRAFGSVDTYSDAGFVFTAPSQILHDPVNDVGIHSLNDFTLLEAFDLPNTVYRDDDGFPSFADNTATFVFTNSWGTAIHVISQMEEATGVLNGSALATYDIR